MMRYYSDLVCSAGFRQF